jgi:predicted aconitase with swiveling domain
LRSRECSSEPCAADDSGQEGIRSRRGRRSARLSRRLQPPLRSRPLSGVITKPGHKLEGLNIRDKILFFPSAKGGIAAGWAFYDIRNKGFAPKAFIFGVTNPVMVQGAVFANIPITEGWSRDPLDCIETGDVVRVDPATKVIELFHRKKMRTTEVLTL